MTTWGTTTRAPIVRSARAATSGEVERLADVFNEYGVPYQFGLSPSGEIPAYLSERAYFAGSVANVFIVMAWGHIITPEGARRALSEWLDAVPASKICGFGGDYAFVDAVYGHQAIARENVARVLSEKVAEGSMSVERAKEIAGWLLHDNAVRIFRLEDRLAAGESRPMRVAAAVS